ncbi:MAG: DUF4012 domain-containing protein [Oscillospiraceae bacterium]|nr:DUF4012 domain-containing protein [Oscillospiraceae bacterium]
MKNRRTKPNKEVGKRRPRSKVYLSLAMLLAAAALLATLCLIAFSFAFSLRSSAYAIRDDLKTVLSCLVRQDADNALAATDSLEEDLGKMDALLASPIGRAAARASFTRTEMNAVNAFSAAGRETTEQLLRPAVDFMQAHPASFRTEEGKPNWKLVGSWVDFLSEKQPELLRFSATMDELSAMPLGKLEKRLSGLQAELGAVKSVTRLAIEAMPSVIKPTLDYARSHPLSSTKTERGGIDLVLINGYFDLFESLCPALDSLCGELCELQDSMQGKDGKMGEWLEKLSTVPYDYEQAKRLLPAVRAFLGSGENKVYLFAAQNSSEIRASGGFPGAMSIIRIQNGEIRVEDFRTVYDMLSAYASDAAGITSDEIKLFSDWFLAPRDADFCPDYERVAFIWAEGYRSRYGEKVDGVVSATPAIIQRLLAILGPVTLSDGSVLNGENAVHMLEYDLYYNYMSAQDNVEYGRIRTDELFAETAKTVLSSLTGNINIKDALKYFHVLEQSAADRTLMLWLADAEEQQLVRDAGLDGGLDRDSTKPHVGIYFSLNNPSRLGWFLDVDPQITEIERREDGSRVYSVKVSFTNTMTKDELDRASDYIAGSLRGIVKGIIHFFAPAGGTISDVTADGGLHFAYSEYEGLELAYSTDIFLWNGATVSAEFVITTAPGEQEDLGLSMTPTLTAYR